MSKAATILKVITIILNVVFLASSLAIIAAFGMPSLHPVFIIIPLLSPVCAILALAMPSIFLSGSMRPVSIALTLFTNLVLISTVIYCFVSWGMPGVPFQNVLIPLWFVMPVLTCITLFLVKGRTQDDSPAGVQVLCSN